MSAEWGGRLDLRAGTTWTPPAVAVSAPVGIVEWGEVPSRLVCGLELGASRIAGVAEVAELAEIGEAGEVAEAPRTLVGGLVMRLLRHCGECSNAAVLGGQDVCECEN